MENNQTAVKFLEQEFKKFLNWQTFAMQYRGVQQDIKQVPYYTTTEFAKAIEQAKQMEREQISKAWEDGDYSYFHSKETGRDFENGEEYYKEKYGKETNSSRVVD